MYPTCRTTCDEGVISRSARDLAPRSSARHLRSRPDAGRKRRERGRAKDVPENADAVGATAPPSPSLLLVDQHGSGTIREHWPRREGGRRTATALLLLPLPSRSAAP